MSNRPASKPSVTELLIAWGDGRRDALDELLPLVYAELRQLAARYLKREPDGHTLQPTALVHEAFVRLVDQRRVKWKNRAHFYGVSAQVMRRILVDHARARKAGKRGSGWDRVPLVEDSVASNGIDVDLLALDGALTRLSEFDPQQERIVELRYFGGLTIEETALALGISPATVVREWTIAKAWLRNELTG